MNKVLLIGRLVHDPELNFTPGAGTAVTKIRLAVDKYNPTTKQREADFIPVVVWGKQAENVSNYMIKGSMIAVAGRIQTRSYDAKDGSKRYVTEVVVSEVKFLSKGTGAAGKENNTSGIGINVDDYDMEPVDDGDIPF